MPPLGVSAIGNMSFFHFFTHFDISKSRFILHKLNVYLYLVSNKCCEFHCRYNCYRRDGNEKADEKLKEGGIEIV